jgi:hypothetical protein
VDLLNSENEVFEAKRLYTNISSDMYLAYARAHFQLGTLLEVLKVKRYGSEEAPLPELGSAHVEELSADCPIEVPEPYKANKNDLDARAAEMLRPAGPAPAATQSLGQDFKSMVEGAQPRNRPAGR